MIGWEELLNSIILMEFVRNILGYIGHKNKRMKIVYTMVLPVLVDIKWAPITKINLHKHLKTQRII